MALLPPRRWASTAATFEAMEGPPSTTSAGFSGSNPIWAQPLGLAKDWAFQIVKQVGNYGEIFDRTFGQASPFKLDRGLNNLWTKGGLMYAAPFR